MIKLTIDHIPVEVPGGTTLMQAAAGAGIFIPSMCYRPGYSNHPSCMVCLVKDSSRNHLVPSCAMPAEDGMEILTSTPDVITARREALALLLSDHSGDCEAPCRVSCPAFMDIPLMNRLIAGGNFEKALEIVHREIALPTVLGYICPAPCEKACKRRQIDQAVSVCLLKRSAACSGSTPVKTALTHSARVCIIGAGPAGLSAAFYLLESGYPCTLFDRNEHPGGSLRYAVPEEKLPREALDRDIRHIRDLGGVFTMGININGEPFRNDILSSFDAVILATGSLVENPVAAEFGLKPDDHGNYVNRLNCSTSMQGVFGCGNIIREQKMAVQSGAQGKLAARFAMRYLQTGIAAGLEDPFPEHSPRSVSTIGHLLPAEFSEYLSESIPAGRTEPAAGFIGGFTEEEAILEAKRCMHCDCRKPAGCKLRQYSEHYGIHRKRTSGMERKPVTRSLQHDLVVYESEKCIRCGLCVEISARHGEMIGMAYTGRGFDVRIAVPFQKTTREVLENAADACIEACPTGALSYKNMEERIEP